MTGEGRARARDLGLVPGRLPTGPANAISDVPGVRVGHATVIAGADIRTGVTAIVHDDLLSGAGALPAGLSVFNGFGKMVGSTQLAELGTLETPVLLTATLSVFRVADALLSYLHERHWGNPPSGNEHRGQEPGTLNPVVAETNDGYLSDIWARPITAEHVRMALDAAANGPIADDTAANGTAADNTAVTNTVAEGCVGAGTGTSALGFKAGIGTASRIVSWAAGPVTLGALVQANFGGELTVLGTPVPAAEALAAAGITDDGEQRFRGAPGGGAPRPSGGSCVIVLVTDAALGSRQLERVASRAFAGMARTGSDFSGRSGDYALAFSTAAGRAAARSDEPVPDSDLDLLFTAAIEATEEAVLNSLFMATTTRGFRGRIRHAVPLDYVTARLRDRPRGDI
jgi:D-aminopeptidase